VHANAEAETAAEAEDPAWVAAYGQVLDGWKAQIAEEPVEYSTPELYYLVYDIDKDGTPELIVKTGTCEADYHGALYTLRDGSAVQVGEEFGLGHSSFYSDPGENGIILPTLTDLKLDKNGGIANYYMPQSDRLLYEALKEYFEG